MLTRIETNPQANLDHLQTFVSQLRHAGKKRLIERATNLEDKDEYINERVVALAALRKELENIPNWQKRGDLLSNKEVEKLFRIIKDEEDFPVLVDPNEIKVEEVTHEKDHEDLPYKKKLKKSIEENDAMLRGHAALLIVDFGLKTKRFLQLKHLFIKEITGILGNMLGESDHLFIKETRLGNDKVNIDASLFFKMLVEALYFIDEESAKPFMDFFNIQLEDFSIERRKRKAS